MLAVTLLAQLGLSLTTHGRRCTPSAVTRRRRAFRHPHHARKGRAYVLARRWPTGRDFAGPRALGRRGANAGGGYLMDAVAAAWIGFWLGPASRTRWERWWGAILGVLSNGLVMLWYRITSKWDIIKGWYHVALAITYIQKR